MQNQLDWVDFVLRSLNFIILLSLLVLVLYALIKLISHIRKRKSLRGLHLARMVCKTCGHIGQPDISMRGNLALEILLWLCGIVPGVVYTLWREQNLFEVCSMCRGKSIIPMDSP